MAKPTYAQVREILKYDSETGKLFWKERPISSFVDGERSASCRAARWNGKYANKEAFTWSTHAGYRMGRIAYEACYAHRVAWLLMTGAWPVDEIDHINGDPSDNRFVNLREATSTINRKNQKRRSDNKSGVTGVVFYKAYSQWTAYIQAGSKTKCLGYFQTKADAVRARKAAERENGYHQNHGRSS
ncbi:HNH endonuclease [Rhizobium sp. BK456]|uniref:HNH endonuclease n=1 Tax=Rhizobium sp. BK456 TaxID=2587007 RepID=UPI0016087FF1|nr:HNH endonuclease [Rhizobium sp. BK456]MBB3521042.1 hypothetical protein [Rhizobium sp. BK456]